MFWRRKWQPTPVIHGILLSHKKEWNWPICSDMEEPRVCHTEWSKSEREKQILYMSIYTWSLEKQYRWIYFQGRNRDTDVENRLVDTAGEGEGGTNSTLAWKIPWTEEPGGLQSMGSLKSRTSLSDFTFTFHFHALEKEMATHSGVLAWRILGTAEPGGLPLWGRTESDTTEAT